MSAQAEVAPPASGPNRPGRSDRPDGAGGPLRVKPPSPLPPERRIAVGAVALVLVVVGAVLVVQARSDDGGEVPGGRWRKVPVPRAARVDDLAPDGPLAQVDGFGRWQTEGSALQASGGVLRSSEGGAIATVDAGNADVLVHAQVVRMTVGSGLLFSSAPGGVPALALRASGTGAWELRWERSGPPPQSLATFAAPTEDVSVQVIRRGDQVKVAFDGKAYDVDLPANTSAGTFVGISSVGPGNELDLFGYLALPAS